MLAAILAAPMVGMGQAGKGQTKQYFEFYLERASPSGPGPDSKTWTTEDGVLQGRGWLFFAGFKEVTVGGMTLTPVDYSCTMDLTIDLATGNGAIKIRETIVFADGGALAIQTAETLSGYNTPDYSAGGSFVGFGSGTLEGVKVQGKTGMGGGIIDRVGTVMGWPD